MGFLIADDVIRYVDANNIELVNELPVGIYEYCFQTMQGSFFKKYKMALPSESMKIYGDAPRITEHCCTAWRLYKKDKDKRSMNFGVLLSGGKGLGKSLTAKLIIRELCTEYPVIVVKSMSPDLVNTCTKLENCIVFIDEFEKIISDQAPDDNGSLPTPQETFLSLLDGNKAGDSNMYLFTANDMCNLNECMISRPGRIRYNCIFESAGVNLIEEYCQDKLDDKSKIPDIVNALLSLRPVSIDIISAIVEELNTFPEESVNDALKYLNIHSSELTCEMEVTMKHVPTGNTCKYMQRITFISGSTDDIYISNPGWETNTAKKAVFSKYNLDTVDNLNIGRLVYTFRGISRLDINGKVDITDNTSLYTNNLVGNDFELVSVYIEDRSLDKNLLFKF